MDVVFLIDHLLRGGADAQLVRVATTLRRRGWKVGVVTMLPSMALTLVDELEAAGVPCCRCAGRMPYLPGLPVAMTLRMIWRLRRWRPAVLVTFNYHGDIMGRVCGRLAGVPAVVASFRTARVKNRFRKWAYRATRGLVRLTASNSHAGNRYLVANGLVPAARAMVIPNGIDLEGYPLDMARAEAEAGLPVRPGSFVWLAVGNLLPSKDYPTLLAAVARLAGTRPVQVLVAGGGPPQAQESLHALARELGVDAHVQFLGSRSDVPRLMRACDAYVLSSAWEGMPNTVMEAMASRLAVVGTDAGGVGELVAHGETGFVVPCGDPAALAGRMAELMDMDPERRRSMGERGRERIQARFEIEGVVDQWERMLRQMIRKGGRTQPVAAAPEPARTDPPRPGAVPPPPAFVVSLDFELMWGVRDSRSVQDYGGRILGERQAIPAMLDLFKRYGIHATWAAVGMTLFETKADLLAHLPDLRPTYRNRSFDPYPALAEVGANEREDPYHFGLSLVRQIQACEGMEIGSHSFCHYYCREEGQDERQFRADLQAWIEAGGRHGIRPVSLVFPRNQGNPDYFGTCADLGFKVFRGNEESRLFEQGYRPGQSPAVRALRLADHYVNLTGHHGFLPRVWMETGMVNCPSSRFLRPFSASLSWLDGLRSGRIKRAMTAAARQGESYHLWWHPHNFGQDLAENLALLEDLLRHYATLRERFGMAPMNMAEVADAVTAPAEPR